MMQLVTAVDILHTMKNQMQNVETELNQMMNRLVVNYRAAQMEKRISEKVLFENVFSLETKEIIFLKNFCAETVNAESV